jgi:aryl-alcohol dehydrogenase-like predicted oxidoreductase
MHKHEFGRTGIEVQVIRMGTWMIEGNQDIERRAVEAMRLGLV